MLFAANPNLIRLYCILLIHTTQIHGMPEEAEAFLKKMSDLSKVVLVTTSGGGDEKVTQFYVDAISTASRIVSIETITKWALPKLVKILKNEYNPIVVKMWKMIDNNGIEEAVNEYYKLKNNDADKYDFSEGEFNRLGYFYMNENKYDEAIAIFKLNVEMYPKSANCYDSLGEAYMLNSDNKLAIENYKKSLELNPNNENAVNMIRQIEKM